MNSDRAKHQILPPSKFGLIQITRQRVRPEMDIKTTEVIPTSNGDKEVQATILIIDDIEQRVNMVISKYPKKKLILHAHPFVSAYLKQGFRSYQRKWFSKHRKWVSIIERNNYPLMKYRFFDEQKNVLVQ